MENKKEIINKLRNEGKKITEIAKQLNMSKSGVLYWLSDDYRTEKIKYQVDHFRNLPKEKKSAIYKKRLPYIRNYLNSKYKNDKDFREKILNRKRKGGKTQ